MTRRWLIGCSLLVHAALGVTAFVTGIWRIERLDHPHRSSIALAVMTPPSPPPEGGHGRSATPELVKKKARRIARDTTQPAERSPERPSTPEVTTASRPGDGDGQGIGEGDGAGRDTGPGDPDGVACLADCGEPTSVCGDGVLEGGERCDDGNRDDGDGCSAACQIEPPPPAIVPPSLLGALRIAGETQIHPPDPVKIQMQRDGRDRTLGVVKVCIDTTGRVASVSLASSTKYPAYDEALLRSARTWRYRPHAVNGVPVAACGMVTFVYAIRR